MHDDNHLNPPLRRIKSFVRRAGRMSLGQQQALQQQWQHWGLSLQTTPYDLTAVFGGDAPTTLEIGFGMGASLLALAKQHPDQHFIGIDVHEAGVGSVLRGITEDKLTNLRVFQADAVEVLRGCIAEHCLDRILLFFPDPWPKKRHHKRRLVQPEFVQLIASKLKPGGLFHIATDWQDYAHHVQEVMAVCPQFVPYDPTQQVLERPASKYEQRGMRLGHDIWDFGFVFSGCPH